MQAFIILGLAAFAAAAPTQFPEPSIGGEPYIIGGQPAEITDHNYQCSLRFGGSHTCGCIIVAANKALTAAHCTDGRAETGFSIYAGSNSRLTGGELRSSLTKSEHENYNDGTCTFCNDVGMLTMSQGLTLGPNIGTITPYRGTNTFAGQSCTISGWGRTRKFDTLTCLGEGSSNILPEMLQAVSMGVISQAECAAAMAPVGGALVTMSHICIFSGTEGSCNGDSGGPMRCMVDGSPVVAGITSWGVSSLGNCLVTYPSAYARVSTYIDWIDQNM